MVKRLNDRLKGIQRRLDVRPGTFCLVSGPPRSGTTAVSDWLGAQPGVIALSESRILVAAHRFLQEVKRMRKLERYSVELERRISGLVFGYYSDRHWLFGRKILVDKEPLGHIAFPDGSFGDFLENLWRISREARLLLMIRHPVPTIWSMQQRAWGYSLADAEPRRNSLDEDIGHWKAGAEIVERYAGAARTLVCRFEDLVREPEKESTRIFRFLGVANGRRFQPRSTKAVGFTAEARMKILKRTGGVVDRLELSEDGPAVDLQTPDPATPGP